MSISELADGMPQETFWERKRRLVALDIERIAIGVFASKGYENVTVDQVARAAGITVRTFYRYFANKEEVLLAMPRRATAQMCEAIAARPVDDNIIDCYRHAIAQRADASIDDERIALLWPDIFGQSTDIPRIVTHPALVAHAVSTIAARMGLRADDTQPRVIGAAISSVLDVAIARWLASGGTDDRQALMLESLDILESIGALIAPRTSAVTQIRPSA